MRLPLDILCMEDHFGEMNFKVAGSRAGALPRCRLRTVMVCLQFAKRASLEWRYVSVCCAGSSENVPAPLGSTVTSAPCG